MPGGATRASSKQSEAERGGSAQKSQIQIKNHVHKNREAPREPASQLARASDLVANFKAGPRLDRSDIKPTKKRYLILLLFCLHSAINALQWIYLSSITSTVSSYYRVNNMAVNWTSIIYMVVYIPLVVPSSWLFEKIGMRNSILLGSLGTTLGSIIKCFACHPDRFELLMLGQTLVAISQLFVLSVPPRLAAVWFPDDQVSLANACGVFGNQLGIGLGFVVPQLVLDSVGSFVEETAAPGDAASSLVATASVTSGLLRLFAGIALFSLLVSLLILFLFDHAPSRPPGLARLQQIIQETAVAEAGITPLVMEGGELAGHTFGALLGDLFTNVNFVLLMASYGLNVGVFYAISTVLNQMISPGWPDANTLVGRLGLLLVVAGMFGSVVSGVILDKTRMYRLVNAGLYLMSLLSMVAFAGTLEWHSSLALHLAVLSLGYSMTGYLFIGYEMSNELTWPRPESVTAGLLNLAAQVFGAILTYSSSYVVDRHGNLAANIYFVAALTIGFALTLMIRARLKRQSAMST